MALALDFEVICRDPREGYLLAEMIAVRHGVALAQSDSPAVAKCRH